MILFGYKYLFMCVDLLLVVVVLICVECNCRIYSLSVLYVTYCDICVLLILTLWLPFMYLCEGG